MEKQDQRFPKSARLRRQFEFERVHGSKFYAADKTLVIKAIANGSDRTRLGLSISRKVGNAVVRNRWKRLIRESFRRQQSKLPTGLDLVVRPRKDAVCEFDLIFDALTKLTRKLSRRIEQANIR